MKLVIGPENASALNPEQRFMQAVGQAMEGPFIRYSKRLELMDLAKELHINRFQANLLIAQAQQQGGNIMDTLSDPYESTESPVMKSQEPVRENWRDKVCLFGAIFILAALADLALMKFVFGG